MKPSKIAELCRDAFTAGGKVILTFPNCFTPVGNFPKGIEVEVTLTHTSYQFEPDEMLAWLFDNGTISSEEAVLTPPRSSCEVFRLP